MLTDIIEILHEIGIPDKAIRKAALHYVQNRFPEINCTLSRANLDNFTTGLMMSGQGTILHERERSGVVSETEDGLHDEAVAGF